MLGKPQMKHSDCWNILLSTSYFDANIDENIIAYSHYYKIGLKLGVEWVAGDFYLWLLNTEN
jgi:hypothetical protein